MTYFLPGIDDSFSAMAVGSDRPVSIHYNGSGLHSIAGPVPFISLNYQPNKTETGSLNSKRVGINITGKIVRNGVDTGVTPPGTGVQSIVSAISALQSLFTDNGGYNGVFEIRCGNLVIFSATGVRLNNFNADKSADNWVFTADYNAELEFFEPYNDGNNSYYIRSSSDSWSIEPLEEYTFTRFSAPISQKSEYHNPNLQPNAATNDDPVPSRDVQGDQFGDNPLLNIINVPQFRISRKLNAIGLPRGTGNEVTYSAYQEAKRWVADRLASAFGSTSGLGHFLGGGNPAFNGPTYLYNHLRTTNFSITDGSFDLSETWLAMPTGMKYIEDYTIESSTSANSLKTIRVQGEIKGLSAVPLSVMSGQEAYLMPNVSGSILLDSSLQQDSGILNPAFQVMDTSPLVNSEINTFYANKYENANSGWIYDIKPYLYRRASMALRSVDRVEENIDPTLAIQPITNFSYTREPLLNVIPVSSSETHIPRKGSISYNFEFTNKTRMISGVLDEIITINETGPTDVINEAFVLGRRLGPVLQDLGSKTTSRKEVSISVTVPPPSTIGGLFLTNTECPLYTGGLVYSTIETIISGLKPFGDRQVSIFGNFDKRTGGATNVQGQAFKSQDTFSWNPTEGTYSRNVSWIHQQCSNDRIYLDN